MMSNLSLAFTYERDCLVKSNILSIVWFQKISIPPPRRELEIPRGWGGVKDPGNSGGEGG